MQAHFDSMFSDFYNHFVEVEGEPDDELSSIGMQVSYFIQEGLRYDHGIHVVALGGISDNCAEEFLKLLREVGFLAEIESPGTLELYKDYDYYGEMTWWMAGPISA